ncbi:MAG: phosphoglycerate kinase [Bacteroidetes bacterium]|nr:MAG: phosphoglycerate kinase [Bacteroidota bacterium]
MSKLNIDQIDLAGRRVLVRLDMNVPLSGFEGDIQVGDDTRLTAVLPTVRAIYEAGGRAILMSHLGRPGGKVVEKYSLRPVAEHLAGLLNLAVTFVPAVTGSLVDEAVSDATPGDILVLENTRFEPGETRNDPVLAQRMAGVGDVFINDAFGTAHRAHASTEGIAHHISQSGTGYLMQREISYLSRLLDEPARPFIGILGGAKVSDKIALIQQLLERVDFLLIGGAMSYTFLKAMGQNTGTSLVEDDLLGLAAELLNQSGERLILPSDHVTADSFSNDAATSVSNGRIPDGNMGLDIGPVTQKRYRELILRAKTIVWNGPMGVFEMSNFAGGTLAVAQAMADATDNNALTVVGGGDSVAAIHQVNLADRVSHVSTGGGAMLEFLEGKTLPGIAALTDAN